MRLLSCVVCCALATPALGQWATVKGRVVFPEKNDIPKRQALNVTQDQKHCLKDGPILDETYLVHPKNRGIKNVVVWLRPLNRQDTEFAATEVHPDDAKRKPADVVIDQPCCMFVKRVTTARVGDTILVKNPAPVTHNFFWDSVENGAFGINVPAGKEWKMPAALALERLPIQYKCTVHPWMTGYVRIFDHPYHAVTDADGNFEIANAPVGKFRIVFWHETGLRGGKDGRFGEVIEITGPTTDLKTIEFEVK